MSEATFAIVKLAAFAVASFPLLVQNLRTGKAGNLANLALLVTGLGLAAVASYAAGSGAESIRPIMWAAGAVIWFGLAAGRVAPAGVAKFMIALLPWFSLPAYLLLVTIGFLLVALVGKLSSGNAGVVAPCFVTGAGIMTFEALGGSL